MKMWYLNLTLCLSSLLSISSVFLFSSLILVTGLFQLFVLFVMLKDRKQKPSVYSFLLRIYLLSALVISFSFAVSVYYLNVRPDLFLRFASTESVLLLMLCLFLIPALLHLAMHYMSVKSQNN